MQRAGECGHCDDGGREAARRTFTRKRRRSSGGVVDADVGIDMDGICVLFFRATQDGCGRSCAVFVTYLRV